MDWIHLAQDADQLLAVVNKVIDPWVPLMAGISLREQLKTSEGLCSMHLVIRDQRFHEQKLSEIMNSLNV